MAVQYTVISDTAATFTRLLVGDNSSFSTIVLWLKQRVETYQKGNTGNRTENTVENSEW